AVSQDKTALPLPATRCDQTMHPPIHAVGPGKNSAEIKNGCRSYNPAAVQGRNARAQVGFSHQTLPRGCKRRSKQNKPEQSGKTAKYRMWKSPAAILSRPQGFPR